MPLMSSCSRVAARRSRQSAFVERARAFKSTNRQLARVVARRRVAGRPRAHLIHRAHRARLPARRRAPSRRARPASRRALTSRRVVTRARADDFAAPRDAGADAARRVARAASARRRAREPAPAGRTHEDAMRRVPGRGDAAVPDVQRHRRDGMDDRREHAAVRQERVRAGDDGRRGSGSGRRRRGRGRASGATRGRRRRRGGLGARGASGINFCSFGARIGDEYLASGVILNQRINQSVVCAREAGGEETGPETRDLYMEMSMSGK